ncbi:phosphotransferase [Paenibacillus sp. RC67]|uniref:phosphotransferase n=1 Tax=Paenibacillus sp. RC67 TaxID=3039392 RepID=UPI0024AE0286|nr:phosphotransferase [Paenibacillus sp. RC67]
MSLASFENGLNEFSLNLSDLIDIVRRATGKTEIELISLYSEPLIKGNMNPATGGVYRLRGELIEDDKIDEWSLILKISAPNVNYSDPTHYNYWRRESLVYSSGLLSQIPQIYKVPECYSIDEKNDSSTWLWIEDLIKKDKKGSWSYDQHIIVARYVGIFNGAYLTHSYSLPDEEFICRNFMKSWISECDRFERKQFNGSLFEYQEKLNDISLKLGKRYEDFCDNKEKLLQKLELLPRVFAHQDIWSKNIHLRNDGRLHIFDWQFASISGIGEEVGRMVGYAISTQLYNPDSIETIIEKIFLSYLQGLHETGWNGDPRLARFGFLTSASFRLLTVVSKLIRKKEEEKVGNLLAAHTLLKMSAEAIKLKNVIFY